MSHLHKDCIVPSEWEVREISHSEAVEFISRWHYAKGAANTSVCRFGLFRKCGTELLGVSMWMPPTARAAQSVCSDHRKVLALSRFCLHPDCPHNSASWFLSQSMRRIDRKRWWVLLTYADSIEGHTGAIYKATNWEFLGIVIAGPRWVDGSGAMRGVKRGNRNMTVDQMRDQGFTRTPPMPKFKYVHRKAGEA